MNLYPIVICCLIFSSCSTNKVIGKRRTIANASLSSCNQLAKTIIAGNDSISAPSSVLFKNSMKKLKAQNLVREKDLDLLLYDPYYQSFIFRNENVEDLKTSALIVELLKKQNPELPPSKIVQKYHRLFHTCGI